MVRTKASNAAPAATRKAVAARAPRKTVGVPRPSCSPSPSGGRSRKGKASVGGNPAKLWATPEWQKGIGSFMKSGEGDGPSGSSAVGGEPRPSSEQMELETGGSGGETITSGSGGVALLNSSIAQLNSDDED